MGRNGKTDEKETTSSKASTKSDRESSEESDGGKKSEDEPEITEAAPYADKPENAREIDESTPSGPLVMRWRSPGSSAEPGSCTEGEDGSPQSISLSVSEVQTAVLLEMRLENPTQPEREPKTRSLPPHPVIPRQPGSEGEPQPVTPIRPLGGKFSQAGKVVNPTETHAQDDSAAGG